MKNEVKRLMSSHGEARIMIYVLVIYDDPKKIMTRVRKYICLVAGLNSCVLSEGGFG